jgi:hypothetical protein
MALKDFKVTIFEAKTLSWWRNRKSKIDMEPPYQRRGHLWAPSDKAYLIDSILNGYDIPKLYIADFTWGDSDLNKKKLPYAIIDGKQRLEAIFDFFEGNIVLNDDFIFLENSTLKLGGMGYKDLQVNYSEIAELFDNYNLMVMSVSAKSEEPINELFVRLNRSKSLTGAEIRNAMTGPAPKVIRDISKHVFFVENIRFQVKRGQDQNAAAKLLTFEYNGGPQETKKRSLDDFVATAKENPEKLELAGRKVLDVLDKMASIFLPNDRLLASSGLLPVYYWFVRDKSEKEHPKLRRFILNFEELRKSNRQLMAEDPSNKNINGQLIEYDNFNRNTNDQQSHYERVKILNSFFQKRKSLFN